MSTPNSCLYGRMFRFLTPFCPHLGFRMSFLTPPVVLTLLLAVTATLSSAAAAAAAGR